MNMLLAFKSFYILSAINLSIYLFLSVCLIIYNFKNTFRVNVERILFIACQLRAVIYGQTYIR